MYLKRHNKPLLVFASNKLAMETCRFIGVISLFRWNPCEMYLWHVIILMIKSDTDDVLALSISRPPWLMLRCVMSFENVGISSTEEMLHKFLKKNGAAGASPNTYYPHTLPLP